MYSVEMFRSKKPHLKLSLDVEEKEIDFGDEEEALGEGDSSQLANDRSFRMSPGVFQKANIQVDGSGVHMVSR